MTGARPSDDYPARPPADPARRGQPHEHAVAAGAPGHAGRNRASWNAAADVYQARHAATLAAEGIGWGVWQIPESQLHILGEVAGRDILELGCGGAQLSIALARAGARPVGLDLSERQLSHARTLTRAAGIDLPLLQADAEALPLAAASFDVVFCDYGAMTFADPDRTVPEVARVLRPGGLFAFNTSSPILDLCWPDDAELAGDRLVHDYFGMHQFDADDGRVSFQLPYSEWIRLFRSCGFTVLDLIEPRPASEATSSFRDDAQRAWSRRWPAECIWRLRAVDASKRIRRVKESAGH